MEGTFPHLINDKRCLPFIVDRTRKNSFHSLPSNPVHRTGVKLVLDKVKLVLS